MSSIQIKKVSITKVGTSAIVNAANEQLMQGGGVCGFIFDAAGVFGNLKVISFQRDRS